VQHSSATLLSSENLLIGAFPPFIITRRLSSKLPLFLNYHLHWISPCRCLNAWFTLPTN
jgi:hypothetical protein